MVQRLTLRKKRKSQNVRGKRRRMTYRKMVHKQTLGKKRKSQNVRGTRRIMTYKKTGRYNSEGGSPWVNNVNDPDTIPKKNILIIPYYVGRYLLDSESTRLKPDTLYSVERNTKVDLTLNRFALTHIISLNDPLFPIAQGDSIKQKHYTAYKSELENNNDEFISISKKGDNNIYFKITKPTEDDKEEDDKEEDALADKAKKGKPLTLEDIENDGTEDEKTHKPSPVSPTTVTHSFQPWWGGKRRRRRQQGLKQNKLQTIKKYYKNK